MPRASLREPASMSASLCGHKYYRRRSFCQGSLRPCHMFTWEAPWRQTGLGPVIYPSRCKWARTVARGHRILAVSRRGHLCPETREGRQNRPSICQASLDNYTLWPASAIHYHPFYHFPPPGASLSLVTCR